MQCGVKEIRRQEGVEDIVRCFGCGEKGHKKWECLRKGEKGRKEEVAPRREVWEKVRKHSGGKGLPPREAAICMEGWTTPREVVTFVECRGCDYKGTKTEENQGQGFLSKGQLCNMWCGSCKEAWDWREEEAKGGRAERLKCDASLPPHASHFNLSALPPFASSSLQSQASLQLPHHILHNCPLLRNPCP